MIWLKALHLISMVAWFAGLFYLPRLFVYHAMARDALSLTRFCTMERKLFWGIMTPSAVVTLACGLAMLWGYAWQAYGSSGWLKSKLVLVFGLVLYHAACGKFMRDLHTGRNRRSHIWFRFFNEVPVLFLVAIILLAVVKPF